ncbi:uncharacterized protein LOC115402444 [Salarias fasciatus]|uniref:uncharacterized protein LOC115402444 n=1 Tax=Salarias fasciatus TaxID=181472 RepID=UPI001176B353|nr:uncharacterized protein LOC115402444 [Salarias fasciatus]
MFLLHLFVLQSAAVAAVVQKAGEDVTLTCEHELEGQRDCNGTTWRYSKPGNTRVVVLVELGKMKENNEIEPDRLKVKRDCSLKIKNVTDQDVGIYNCQQYKSDSSENHILVNRSDKRLSVATIVTEHEVDDEETLKCFVTSSEENCELEVKWKIKDQDIDKDNKEIKTGHNRCSATVTLKKSHYLHPQTHFLSCEVTDSRTGEKLRFSPRPSGWWWWLYLVVALGLIVLLITAVVIIRWKRTKGKKTVVDENTADAEDGISYATISYSKKTSSDVRAHGGDGETVTYSTVRASSSPAAASAEPSNLYSTIKFK